MKSIIKKYWFVAVVVLIISFLAVYDQLLPLWTFDTMCIHVALFESDDGIVLHSGESYDFHFYRGYCDILQPKEAALQVISTPGLDHYYGYSQVTILHDGTPIDDETWSSHHYVKFSRDFKCGDNVITFRNNGPDTITINKVTVGIIPDSPKRCNGIYIQDDCSRFESENGCVCIEDSPTLSKYCTQKITTTTTLPGGGSQNDDSYLSILAIAFLVIVIIAFIKK